MNKDSAEYQKSLAISIQAIDSSHHLLERRFGRRLMPDRSEYGCGFYGCVFPIPSSDLVLKVTTDGTEAIFAANISNREPKSGLVKYKNAVELPSVKSKSVFALWREEAEHIGDLDAIMEIVDPIDNRDAFIHDMYDVKEAGTYLFDTVINSDNAQRSLNTLWNYVRSGLIGGEEDDEVWDYDVPISSLLTRSVGSMASEADHLSRLWGIFNRAVYSMKDSGTLGRILGDCIHELIQKGFAITDLHEGNISIVDRGVKKVPAITDPSQVLILNGSRFKLPQKV